jgi:hypothetical protein
LVKKLGIQTVALESTGIYWISLYEVLEQHGFEIRVVNAQHIKHVPGRTKTDVLDCQWIQKLHSFGLLNGSFRPDQQIRKLRRLTAKSSTTFCQGTGRLPPQHPLPELAQLELFPQFAPYPAIPKLPWPPYYQARSLPGPAYGLTRLSHTPKRAFFGTRS